MTTVAVRREERKIDPSKILSRYEQYFKNNFALLLTAKKGLAAKAVFDFISVSNFETMLVESTLNKSMKTFQNYKEKKTQLDVVTSEKLLKLFALYNKGKEVFGSVESFAEWLSKPAYGIGNTVPQTIMDTMTGIDLINEELVRIEYGDLA